MDPRDTKPPPSVGTVLAGGRSRRMGRDKALLPHRGWTMLEDMALQLEAAGMERVVLSGDRPGWPWPFVPDGRADAGPIEGIAAVAGTLPDCDLIVVPVDMPRLTPFLIRGLLQGQGLASHYVGQMLPLRLQLCEQTRAALDRMSERRGRDRSLRSLLASLGSTALPVPTAAAGDLSNCNTPNEWEAMRFHENPDRKPDDAFSRERE